MNEIMNKIFEKYNFSKTWEENNRIFFTNLDKKIVSYFILNFIDCSNIENDEILIREEMNKLENEYVNHDNEMGIRYSIINSLKNEQEISQIDKNTSAIYLVKFSEVNMLKKYRNLIYSIEESPDYFKRYILPYTEKQVAELKDALSDYGRDNIVEKLSELADVEEDYYSLMNGPNNSSYELVIRLFSKIPFLQYKFKATSNDFSLEKMVNDSVKDDLEKYDKAIRENKIEIEDLITLEENDITEKEIDIILDSLIEAVE
ncbi:ABC-three component system middle component 1 [Pectinatus frisingensis]|uniref:ABC-three component system middle component 1 n=1 Tax=Pectinatus frisingensis TaxID=865 RepID=UPI003D808512